MSLRAKIALVALLGIFLIPVSTSSLRGLTHVLTCEDEVAASLFVDNTAGQDDSVLLSAESTEREDVGAGLCGGLEVDLQVTSSTERRAQVRVTVTNLTEREWQGSIELRFDGTPVPVAIGTLPPLATKSDTVELRVSPGEHYEITGTLLIGP